VGNFSVRKSASNTVTSNFVSEKVPQPLARPKGRLLRFASPLARGGEGAGLVAGQAALGVRGWSSRGTSKVRGQPRTNTYHHLEKLLCDDGDDEDDP
jgi:hypothetical protein